MKHRTLIAAAVLALGIGAAPAAAEIDEIKYPTTSQNSEVLVPKDARKGAPVMILLPFTGGRARRLYNWRYTAVLQELAQQYGLIVVIPEDRVGQDSYDTPAAWSALLTHYTDKLAKDADEVVQKYGADPKRIYLAGFSMGGDLAWALPQRDPAHYAGAIVMGSRTSYRDRKGIAALAGKKFRYYMFMGEGEYGPRIDGMNAGRKELDKAGIAYESGGAGVNEDHRPAPPEVFWRAAHYVMNLKPPREWVEPPAAWSGGAGTAAQEESEPKEREPELPGLMPEGEKAPTDCNYVAYEDERVEAFSHSRMGASKNWGYKNRKGEVKIRPQFTDANDFENGLADAYVDYDAYYVNCNGNAFDVLYDQGADDFSDGLVRFTVGPAMGYRDRTGKVAIKAQFEYAGPFCKGVAQVSDGRCNVERDDENDIVGLYCTGWKFIDKQGRTVPRPKNWKCEDPNLELSDDP